MFKLLKIVYLNMFNNENNDTMTKPELKVEIEKLARETNSTFIEACKAMQSAAATMKNEEMILAIHELKMESL